MTVMHAFKKIPFGVCGLFLLFVWSSLGAQNAATRLRGYGLKNFSPHYIEAVDAYYAAEKLVRAGSYIKAAQLLDTFWQKYPQGDAVWHALPEQAGGVFIGHPPAYTALTMLSKIAHTFSDGRPRATEILQMTVVLPKTARGNDPGTLQEALANQGTERVLQLDARIAAGNYRAVRESLWLFNEYLSALLGGKVQVRQKFVQLPIMLDLYNLPLAAGGLNNTLGPKSYEQLWTAVASTTLQAETDFWMIVHPSNIPSNSDVRNGIYLARGAMARGPAGAPCLVVDDLFILQASPHFKVNEKPFSNMEQQLYLPQFYQHELFHYIFSKFPELKLEASPHQWHDRKTWPSDFLGSFESDYYSEAMEKRILVAPTPLVTYFRFQSPPAKFWKSVSPESLVGEYRREPVENGWHTGDIVQEDGKFMWKNRAGAKWGLIYNAKGEFETNPSNPYHQNPAGRAFRLQVPRDPDGRFGTEVSGFIFNNELYRRIR